MLKAIRSAKNGQRKIFAAIVIAALAIVGIVKAAEISDLSTTDASNNSCWFEGQTPSSVNNCARADLGIIARWYNDWNGSLATGGSANAYTLSANQTIGAYFDGLKLTFEASFDNTGPATLNVDSVGAATIAKYGAVELESGDIGAGGKYTVVYDGSRFQLANAVTPLASTVTSGNIPLFSGTTGKFTDSGVSSTGISALSSAAITSVKDEDTMSSNSATALATQQSIKAYVDAHTSLTLGTEQASTSGTAINFTSIPAGTKRITVQFVGISTNGSSSIIVQIGDSGGIETSGYVGAASTIAATVSAAAYTTGFGISEVTASGEVHHGVMVLTLEDASQNTWVAAAMTSRSDTAATGIGAGTKSLSATLDRVRVTTVNGTDAFDAGVLNIQYE